LAEEKNCVLPERIKLEWKRDQLAMDIALREVTLNQFDPVRRAAVFVEPSPPGYTRRNLAELTGGSRDDRRTRTRHTLSPPEPSNGIKLGRPAPIGEETPVVPKLGRAAVPTGDLQPIRVEEELVGAPAPTPPVSQAAQAANWELTSVDPFGINR
jgi:hypothetical protein